MAGFQALLFATVLFFVMRAEVDAYQRLFEPRDVLPLLPKSISWPVLNTLYSAVDLLPEFVGAVSSQNESVAWNGTCFLQNEAYMTYTDPKEDGHRGGGILHIQVYNVFNSLCLYYIIILLCETALIILYIFIGPHISIQTSVYI